MYVIRQAHACKKSDVPLDQNQPPLFQPKGNARMPQTPNDYTYNAA